MDEMLSYTYQKAVLLLSNLDEMLCPMYETAADFMSYWGVSKSSEWGVKSCIWDINRPYVMQRG